MESLTSRHNTTLRYPNKIYELSEVLEREYIKAVKDEEDVMRTHSIPWDARERSLDKILLRTPLSMTQPQPDQLELALAGLTSAIQLGQRELVIHHHWPGLPETGVGTLQLGVSLMP